MSRDGRCAAVNLRTKGLISCENSMSESKVQAQIRIESKANEGLVRHKALRTKRRQSVRACGSPKRKQPRPEWDDGKREGGILEQW